MGENLPREHLYILLDIARFGVGKPHDHLEEILAVLLCFGDSQRSEAFKITTNAVLLLDGKAHVDKLLEQIYCVYTGDEVFVLFFPPDTAYANATSLSGLQCNGCKGGSYSTALLRPFELDKPPLCIKLFQSPVVTHLIEISVNLENRF